MKRAGNPCVFAMVKEFFYLGTCIFAWGMIQ